MKLANIMLAIGGGRDNTLPKYEVTAAEIAVLQAIHGEDAVFDVDPTTKDAMNDYGRLRTNREELIRLKAIYGRAKDGQGNAIVEGLYPGSAARVFEDFDELGLPDDYFKALGRVAARAEEGAPARPKTKAELIAYAETRGIEVNKKGKAADILAEIEAVENQPRPGADDLDGVPPVDEDGIGDMSTETGIFK